MNNTAEMALTMVAMLCAVGAAAILYVPRWWSEYKLFGWLLIAVAVVLLALAGWGMFLPDVEVPGG